VADFRKNLKIGDLSSAPGVRECLQFFTREKQWITEQQIQLCRVPAPTFLEMDRARWMLDQFTSCGCQASIDAAGNVVAFPAPGSEGPFVALTAHLDTVLAPRRPEEIFVDSSGRICGPGASDNGAGLAALIAVARAIRSAPEIQDCRRNLALIANVGEEGEGNLSGMRYLCRQSPLARKIAGFLVLDGATTSHITCQALGSRRFAVTFNGQGGHSWSDFGIGNPVHALGRTIAYFSETRVNGAPRASYSFGTVEGGTSVNTIAAAARAKVDIRSESEVKIEELVEALSAAASRAEDAENERATGGKVSFKIKEIGSRPAGQLAPNSVFLPYLRAVDAHLGIRSYLDCASTDANIPLSLGIPALSIGAGGNGGGAHTAQEWFHPDGRDLGLKRIFLAICLLLRSATLESPPSR
jgi:acetylornithine deacetylase/succinyl-diaminopimelate desuccinylase-like protein